jgi:hypothetical protein
MSAQCPEKKPKPPPKLGPYSRVLRRGAIARSIDGRSTEGRFLRDFESQMAEHLGGNPSTPERLLISRLARTSLRIMLLEEKMDAGTWTDLDSRTHSGLQSAFRGMLGALSTRSPKSAPQAAEDSLRALRERYGVGGGDAK